MSIKPTCKTAPLAQGLYVFEALSNVKETGAAIEAQSARTGR